MGCVNADVLLQTKMCIHAHGHKGSNHQVKCMGVDCWYANIISGYNWARLAKDRPNSPKMGLQLNVYISPQWDPISLNLPLYVV